MNCTRDDKAITNWFGFRDIERKRVEMRELLDRLQADYASFWQRRNQMKTASVIMGNRDKL